MTEELETLRARVAELESQVANQAAQITGRHTYVGQDFTFRIERLQEQLAAAQAHNAQLRELLFEAKQEITEPACNHDTGMLMLDLLERIEIAITATPDTSALDALRKDAERYRWLREFPNNRTPSISSWAVSPDRPETFLKYGTYLDAAIDAARSK